MPTCEITVHNRQRKVRLDLPWLREFAARALPECSAHAAVPNAPLSQLSEVGVSIVSDAVIADVHLRFMQIGGATDVITFEHGDILISAETAKRQARQYGQKLDAELGLYIIHGLLHLNGFDDIKPADATKMHKLQDRILKKVLEEIKA
jgi:probable rRNA maturation factor